MNPDSRRAGVRGSRSSTAMAFFRLNQNSAMQWFGSALGVVLGVACALLAWGLSYVPIVQGTEEWLLDRLFTLRGTRASSHQVTLVDIDDQSLDALGKPLVYLSPELAEIVAYLTDQGVAAIGLDVLVPDSYTGLRALEEGAEGDAAAMGRAIEKSGKVVLPEWPTAGQTVRPLLEWQAKALGDSSSDLTDFGFVNLTEDYDHFMRRQQLAATVSQATHRSGDSLSARSTHQPSPNDRETLQFALALMAKATRQPVSYDAGRKELRLGSEVIPLDAEEKLRINFVGAPGTFEPRKLFDLLQDARRKRANPEFRGEIVIIGLVGKGSQDVFNTPYNNRYGDYLRSRGSGLMSGAEIHANIVATLQDRAYIRTPWWLTSLPWLLVMGAALGLAFFRLGLIWGLLLAVAHHFGWEAAAFLAFLAGNWRVPMSGMLILGPLAYSAAFAWRFRVLRQVLRAVKSAPIARALERDPRRLRLGGESRTITVLFADIRDFTAFSERHAPEQVVLLLNAYFGVIIPVIEAEGGVINQFMGDGIMVLFGAIADRPDHASAAVRAALATIRAIEDSRSLWQSLGFESLRIGIGVHTGTVLLGAVGSPDRLDFTAIGDTINAAARVEAENKRIGSSILITGETRAAVPVAERSQLGIRQEGLLATVKGKQVELTLHVVEDPRAGAAARASSARGDASKSIGDAYHAVSRNSLDDRARGQ